MFHDNILVIPGKAGDLVNSAEAGSSVHIFKLAFVNPGKAGDFVNSAETGSSVHTSF